MLRIIIAEEEISEYGEYYTYTKKEIVVVCGSMLAINPAIKKFLSDNKYKWSDYHRKYYRKTGESERDYSLVRFYIAEVEINKPIGHNFEVFKRYDYKE